MLTAVECNDKLTQHWGGNAPPSKSLGGQLSPLPPLFLLHWHLQKITFLITCESFITIQVEKEKQSVLVELQELEELVGHVISTDFCCTIKQDLQSLAEGEDGVI